jgi:hypothetical protein
MPIGRVADAGRIQVNIGSQVPAKQFGLVRRG